MRVFLYIIGQGVYWQNQESTIIIVNDLSAQIVLSEYQGEIIADMPITLRFTNQGAENTHYILSYGQIGTQYDLWFDSKVLDEDTIAQIIQHAALVDVSGSK